MESTWGVEDRIVVDRDIVTGLAVEMFGSKNKQHDKENKMEKEYLEKFTGQVIPSCGLVQYEELVQQLTCLLCNQVVTTPLAQCRKGHLYCKECRINNKIVSCKVFKQTFPEGPNIALEKILSLLAFPCRYGWVVLIVIPGQRSLFL